MGALLVSHLQDLARVSFESDPFELAFLVHKQTVHWSARPLASAYEPHSAVTDLIQGLFQRLHDQSFFVLRERIFTTATASDFDRATVKVAAKRMTDQILSPTSSAFEDIAFKRLRDVALSELTFSRETPATISPATTDVSAFWSGPLPSNDEDWLKLCSRFADSVERGQVLHKYHRPLAALIVSRDGKLLSAATHEGALDKTQHAELRAVQGWFAAHHSSLPEGCRAYVSLKPCRMCAAALARVSADPEKLKVIYLNDDPGSHARTTVLSSQVEQKMASALTVLEGEIEAFSKSSRSPRHD